VNEALSALLASLAAIDHADGTVRWLFYSRDSHHYAAARRYVPDYYRRKIVIAAVDRLEAAGLVDHQQTRPSPSALYRSRLRATGRLRQQICRLHAAAFVFRPRELVVVRDATGQPLPYRETAATQDLRRDVMAHNAFLEGVDVVLRHPRVNYDAQGFVVIGGRRLDPGRKLAYRVFNGDFRRGGRWYGSWWQAVPSKIRKGLYLNGAATSEVDIRACHIRLLCAAARIDLGDVDAYDGLGLPRSDVKLAVNVMLNASSWRSARAALIERLRENYGPSAAAHVDATRNAIERRFPDLGVYWNSGCGLVLQNIDADICARVQRRLRAERIPCLSVHDSFIVPQSAREFAETTIAAVFQTTCERLSRKGRLSACRA
jgi:hypothetical protein